MNALHILRLAAVDLWEESWHLLPLGLAGGLLGLFLVPLPFVMAAHYAASKRITEKRVLSLTGWWRDGLDCAPFLYRWALVSLVVTIVLATSVLFYARADSGWAQALGLLTAGLLFLWWLPQPYVPALYLRQEDHRLRIALRNAAVLALGRPLATLVMWGSTLLIALLLALVAWPLMLLVLVWLPLVSTRVVWLQVRTE